MTHSSIRTSLSNALIRLKLTSRAGEHLRARALVGGADLLALSVIIAGLSGTNVFEILAPISNISGLTVTLSTMHEHRALGVVVAHFGSAVDWEARGLQRLSCALC